MQYLKALLGISALLAVITPASASAGPTYGLAISAADGVPARGSVTVSWQASVADPAGTCLKPTDPSYGRCAGQVLIRVVPATTACSVAAAGQTWQLDQQVGAMQLRTAVVGENRVCATMTAGTTNPAVVAQAETTFTTADVYPTADLDCSHFPTQAAAQQEFNRWRPADPHALDGDGDGKVCERSPCPCYTGAEYPNPPPIVALPPATPGPAPVVTPGPAPAPTAPPTTEPSETAAAQAPARSVATLARGRLRLARLPVVREMDGTCAGIKVSVRVRSGRAAVTKTGRLRWDGEACRLTLVIRLKGKLAQAKKVAVAIRGSGVKKTLVVER